LRFRDDRSGQRFCGFSNAYTYGDSHVDSYRYSNTGVDTYIDADCDSDSKRKHNAK
jgi:hypothetical protein